MAGDIGLFYGSTTCYTEIAAEKIRDCIGQHRVDIFNIARCPLTLANQYSQLILGIPTWDYGELQEDWEAAWPHLDEVTWANKAVALYGLGDQFGYPDWFQDAMGYLWSYVSERGAHCVGLWSAAPYTFAKSQALTADGRHFVGLALDEDSEYALNDDRIQRWSAQVLREFADADRGAP